MRRPAPEGSTTQQGAIDHEHQPGGVLVPISPLGTVVWKMSRLSTKGAYALMALLGALFGGASSFVYFNINDVERIAAEADGMPLWSAYQLPFTLPCASVGALCAIMLWWLLERRQRR